jgi:hypothetical protein
MQPWMQQPAAGSNPACQLSVCSGVLGLGVGWQLEMQVVWSRGYLVSGEVCDSLVSAAKKSNLWLVIVLPALTS